MEPVRISMDGATIVGYLIRVDSSDNKRPLLMTQSGFDGTAEEMFFVIGKAALERGYNVLLFEGPGQGQVLREQRVPFRHDWEAVVTPIVDEMLRRPYVDSDSIALYGASLGGYLVPRALAFEHRITCGIANGGVYDFHRVATAGIPGEVLALAPAHFDAAIKCESKQEPLVRWFFRHGMLAFAANAPNELIKKTEPFTLSGITSQITADLLVVDSEGDYRMQGQARQLYDELPGPKTFMLFTNAEGAGEHCQVGAYQLSAERILDWLDDRMGRASSP